MIIQTLTIILIILASAFSFILCFYIFIISEYGHEYFLRRSIIKVLDEHHASFEEISEKDFLGLTEFFGLEDFKSKHPKGKVLFFKWDRKIEQVNLQKLLFSSLGNKGYECSLIHHNNCQFGEFKVKGKFLKYFIGIIEGKCIPNSFFIRIEYHE
jgi:hypothetical protein